MYTTTVFSIIVLSIRFYTKTNIHLNLTERKSAINMYQGYFKAPLVFFKVFFYEIFDVTWLLNRVNI